MNPIEEAIQDGLIQPVVLENDWIYTDKNYSELETLVVQDMWEEFGCEYPYCSVDDVKAFWASKGIE
jgi:hypothetical protein